MATVLLVDDDLMVLTFCSQVLGEIGGMRVLHAASGGEAMEVARRHPGVIEILVSDITMPPGMGGAELAEQLTRVWPHIRVLLMSGHKPEELVLNPSWQFLSKPFRPEDLLSKVAVLSGSVARPVSLSQETPVPK